MSFFFTALTWDCSAVGHESYFLFPNYTTFSPGATAPSGPGLPHYRGFTTTLRHTTLRHTSLRHASLRHTTLRHTTLRHASLRHTTLRHTTLRHTTLRHTTLRHASLSRTHLEDWLARRRDLYLTTDNTHKRYIHTTCGIRTHNPSKRAAAEVLLRPRGHWDRHWHYLDLNRFFSLLHFTEFWGKFEHAIVPIQELTFAPIDISLDL
jgi:hypothetical protein